MTTVSRETMQLEAYAALLRKWNPTINLVAPATLPNLEARHIADSLQLTRTAGDAAGDWLDIGSGGGLPGIVIAVSRPDLSMSLLESDKRKCSFLRSAARELGLENVKIINDRIEQAAPQATNNVSARALAPLPLLLSYVSRHLAPDGTAWLMKGRNWRSEVDDARKDWNFDLCTHKSQTDEEAVILQITGIRHA